MEGIHRQDDRYYCQYRHWWLRSWAGDGDRGAKAVCEARPQCTLRIKYRWYTSRGSSPSVRPGAHTVHHRQQDVHHAGDHHQR